MLIFAKIHVQARTELSSEDIVHDLDGNRIGAIPRRRQLRGKDHALRGTWTVDQVDGVLCWLRDFWKVFPGSIAGLPFCEKLLQCRSYFVQCRISDNEQCG